MGRDEQQGKIEVEDEESSVIGSRSKMVLRSKSLRMNGSCAITGNPARVSDNSSRTTRTSTFGGKTIPSEVCQEEQVTTSLPVSEAHPSTSRQSSQAQPSTSRSRQASPAQPSTSRQAYQAQPNTSDNRMDTLESLNSALESRPQIPNPTPSTSQLTSKNVTAKRKILTTSVYPYDGTVGVVCICSGCRMEPLRGTHYKGPSDLCSACVHRGVHGEHIFLVLRIMPQIRKFVNRDTRSSHNPEAPLLSKTSAILSKKNLAPFAADSDEVNVGPPCDKCGKHCMKTDESLYRCVNCPEYFNCSECFDQDELSHEDGHFLAMTSSVRHVNKWHDCNGRHCCQLTVRITN